MYGLGLVFLKNHVLPYERAQPLWSFSEGSSEVRLVATQERAFLVVATKLWNSVPGEICLSLSITLFHQRVKPFFFFSSFVIPLLILLPVQVLIAVLYVCMFQS